MSRPFTLGRTAAVLVLVLFAATGLPVASQTPTTDMMRGSDLQNKTDPAVQASEALGKAERALRKAHKLEGELASGTAKKPDAVRNKIGKAYRKAETEASKALGFDPRLVGAYLARGQARLALGTFEGAAGDCNMAYTLDRSNQEALFCYGRGELGQAHGGQAVAAFNKLTDAELKADLRAVIERWIESDPAEAERRRTAAMLARADQG